MNVNFNIAASAYGQAQKLISQAGQQADVKTNPLVTETEKNGFAKLVEDSLQSVVESGKVADAKSLEMINGEANIVDVVTAVAEAEIAVESMVAIRDRVIKAYEEIMRMPI